MESREDGPGGSDKVRMMIEIQGVHKTFPQGGKVVKAVSDACMSVSKGERVFIHGPSGAGKSTLLQIMGGLNKPSSGNVRYDGKDIYRISDRKRSYLRSSRIGFVFQFYHLLGELSVLENVMLPARIKGGFGKRDLKERAMDLLGMVGMISRMKHKPSQLSGGEIQRTAIARGLINSPEVLFCDEPTGNLDSEMSRQIYRLIFELSEREQMGVVIVSHQGITEGFFHSKYFMKDGKISKVAEKG